MDGRNTSMENAVSSLLPREPFHPTLENGEDAVNSNGTQNLIEFLCDFKIKEGNCQSIRDCLWMISLKTSNRLNVWEFLDSSQLTCTFIHFSYVTEIDEIV